MRKDEYICTKYIMRITKFAKGTIVKITLYKEYAYHLIYIYIFVVIYCSSISVEDIEI